MLRNHQPFFTSFRSKREDFEVCSGEEREMYANFDVPSLELVLTGKMQVAY